MFRKPKFKLGQTVQVKDGYRDEDSGTPMDGWHGRIVELRPADEMMLLALDSITLRNLPEGYVEECEEEGLDWASYYIGYDDVAPAPARDTERDVETAVAELSAKAGWAYLGAEGRAMNAILTGVDLDDEMAQQEAWRNHLQKALSFPFKAVVEEPQPYRSPVGAGDRVRVQGIADVDDLYGVLVQVKRKYSTFVMPLADLKALDEASSNYEPVYLYAVWFANR